MQRKRYYIVRLAQSLIPLWLILTLNFFLFRLLPGDPIRLLFSDPRIPLETLEGLRSQFGLDGTLWQQYGFYLLNTLKGELGTSFVYNTPVSKLLAERLVNTVILLFPATVLSILLGCVFGIVAAVRHGRASDFIALSLSQLL